MIQRRFRSLALSASFMLVMAALPMGTAQAFEIGHARVVSAASEPLRIRVQLHNVQDYSGLRANLAPVDQWAQYGLTPPANASSITVRVDAQNSALLIESPQGSEQKIIDLLLDVLSPQGNQKHQVSVFNAAAMLTPTLSSPATDSHPEGAGLGDRQGTPSTDYASALTVQRGDTLSALARRHTPQGVTQFQYMAALHALNRQHFTHENMNLIQAGKRLQQPSLEQIQQFSDAQARQIFSQQAQWFEGYKALRASGKAAHLAAAEASEGLTQAAPAAPVEQPQLGDRLELSQADTAAVAADAAVSTAEQLKHTTQQVSQLEDNLSNLSQALHAQGESAKDLVLDGARELGVELGPLSSSADLNSPSAASANSLTNGATSEPNASEALPLSKAGKTLSWIQEHMLIVMASLLVLLVVITVWILRRANTSRGDMESPAPVSPDMVREKLEKINLDLDVPPSDEPPKPQA